MYLDKELQTMTLHFTRPFKRTDTAFIHGAGLLTVNGEELDDESFN